ncbi:MAG: transporter substrate-binding domain-containing protein [Desulfobacterales bacterium]|nr:transporter substrate-binding domain-containing protein [Desulfobacterales bacterium]
MGLLLGYLSPVLCQANPDLRHSIKASVKTDTHNIEHFKDVTLDQTPDNFKWNENHSPIRIGVVNRFFPLGYTNEMGQLAGIDIDILALLNQKLDNALVIVPGTFKENFQKVKDGTLDAMMDLTPRPEREPYFNFTRPYSNVPHVIVARKDKPFYYRLSDLSGKTLAIEDGFFTIKVISKKYPGIRIHTYKSTIDALESVLRGNVDAYIGNQAVAAHHLEKTSFKNLEIHGQVEETRSISAIGVRKDLPELTKKLDRVISGLDPESLSDIEKKWGVAKFNKQPSPQIPLTPVEKEFLAHHPVIRLPYFKHSLPYIGVKDDQPAGFSVDLISLLARKAGFLIDWHFTENTSDALTALRGHKVDVFSALRKTEERKKHYLFSDPFHDCQFILFTRKNHPNLQTASDLRESVLTFPKEYVDVLHTKNFYPGLDIIESDTPETSLKLLASGKADVAIMERSQGLGLINRLELKGIIEAGEAYPNITPEANNIYIGIRNDWPELVEILNKSLASLSWAEMESLRRKWMITGHENQYTLHKHADLSLIRLVILTLLTFCVVWGFWWLLNRYVRLEQVHGITLGKSRFGVLTGVIIFIIMMCLLSWFVLKRTKEIHYHQIHDRLVEMVHSADNRLNTWIEKRKGIVEVLGRDPELKRIVQQLRKIPADSPDLAASRVISQIQKLIKDRSKSLPNIGFFIIDSDLRTIASMQNSNIGTKNFIASQRPDLITRAFQGEVVFVPAIESDVRPTEKTENLEIPSQPTQYFMGPVRDADGWISSLIAIQVDSSSDLTDELNGFRRGHSTEAYVFDQNGVFLSESRNNNQLRHIGLLSGKPESSLKLEVRDPGVNLIKGETPALERSDQPFTLLATRVFELKEQPRQENISKYWYSPRHNLESYRDYRGVPVFGAGLWNDRLEMGLAAEIDVEEALLGYYLTRLTLLLVLGIALVLSTVGALIVLFAGERTNRALLRARDELEYKVLERTKALAENQDKLRETQKQTLRILDSAGEGIFGLDRSGCMTFMNRAGLSLLEYQEHEVIGKDAHTLIHHSLHDGSLYPKSECPIVLACNQGQASAGGEDLFWKKDKTWFPMEYTATPIVTDSGNDGAVVTFRDITLRKEAEKTSEESKQALETSEEYLSQIVNFLPEPTFTLDANGQVALWNRKMEALTGIHAKDIIGKNNYSHAIPFCGKRQPMLADLAIDPEKNKKHG